MFAPILRTTCHGKNQIRRLGSSPLDVADVIGWLSSMVLLLTVGHQVRKQWLSEETEGISKWLFLGQIVASIGFAIYSWMLQNWIFVCTNSLMLVNASIGYWVLQRNRRKKSEGGAAQLVEGER